MSKREVFITPLDRLDKPDLPWISSLDMISDQSENSHIIPTALREPDFTEALDALLDAEELLKKLQLPSRLIAIANKRDAKCKLNQADQMYLLRWRKILKERGYNL